MLPEEPSLSTWSGAWYICWEPLARVGDQADPPASSTDYFTFQSYASDISDPKVAVTEGKSPLLPVRKRDNRTGGTHCPPWFNLRPGDSRRAEGRLH